MPPDENRVVVRDVKCLVFPAVGGVVACSAASTPFLVTDAAGVEVPEVSEYLRHIAAGDFSAASARSYATALLRCLRFLHAVGWRGIGPTGGRCVTSCCGCARPGRRGCGVMARRSREVSTRGQEGGSSVSGSRQRRSTTTWRWGPSSIASTWNAGRAAAQSGAVAQSRQCRPQPAGTVSAPPPRCLRQWVPDYEPRAIPDGLFDELFTALPSVRDRRSWLCACRPARVRRSCWACVAPTSAVETIWSL
jgi:hypothetical protein